MLNGSLKFARCCSLQTSFTPPEQRRTRRLHGLELPLHPQQVTGWIVLISLTICTFSVVLPHLGPTIRLPITITLIIILILHLIAHLVTLCLDPADHQVRKQPSNLVVPELDRSKHLHVIENGRCHLCNITTTCKRTKHCSICNKCVIQFDHHCMWLNNCIGGRNYSAFIICVISAITAALTVFCLTVAQLTTTLDNRYNNYNLTMDNVTLPLLPVQGTGSLIIISIVGILSAIAAALLIHLCIFHGYIACLGLTTYEYIRNKREKNTVNTLQQQIIHEPQPFCIDPVRYHFCNTVNTKDGEQPTTNQVYICSTHTQPNSTNAITDKAKRNFHLYFSYETHEDATSIQLSSRTILDNQQLNVEQPIELKPSTPSPVSCCFSIMNSNTWLDRVKNKKTRPTNNNDTDDKTVTRCTTVRRIQTFLRTRLRKNARQRAIDSSRSRKNRVTPVTSPEVNDKDIGIQAISIVPTDDIQSNSLNQQRPPINLAPLNLPSRQRCEPLKITEETSDVIFTLPAVKRNQQHLRIRRPSFHRRPRFKMSPHITQTAQLSPIPESELSKPASPRSPQLKHFSFPPTNSSIN